MIKLNGMTVPVAVGWLLLAMWGSAVAQDKPGKLRSEMTKAEKEYFSLYNKLNTDPQFAIVCRMDTPTGSNFAVRVCQPRYQMHAAEKSATERMQSAIAASQTTGSANANVPNVAAPSGGGGGLVGQPNLDEAFRQNMLAVQQKSPELQALGKKRDELQARYDEAMKGKSAQR